MYDFFNDIVEGGRGHFLETSISLQFIRRELKLEIGTKVPESEMINLLAAKNIPRKNIIEMLEILEREGLLDRSK